MEREDNSDKLPGKNEVNKYALSDTLRNLHAKFNAETPTTLGFSTFLKMCPKNMMGIQWTRRRQCLCIDHANMALLLQAVKNLPKSVTAALDVPLREVEQHLDDLPEDVMQFRQWQRVETTSKSGKQFMATQKVQLHESKSKFQERFLASLTETRAHSKRVVTQYSEVRNLRAKLPCTHITIQMDYSENFKTSYQDAVQVAYFEGQQITLHPMVIHYSSGGELTHKSIVAVSDEGSHSAATTFACIKGIQQQLHEFVPNLATVHYITDSPASQYRNKTIAALLSKHKVLFGTSASWHWLERGHGKGPCDGVGGAVKKLADTAIKRGSIILNAKDFLEIVRVQTKTIHFVLVTPGDVAKCQRSISGWDIAAVTGLSKAHTMVPVGANLKMRETSCCQPCCFDGDFKSTCPGWTDTGVKVILPLTLRTVTPPTRQTITSPTHVRAAEGTVVIPKHKQFHGAYLKVDNGINKPLYAQFNEFPVLDLEDKLTHHDGSPFIRKREFVKVTTQTPIPHKAKKQFCEICNFSFTNMRDHTSTSGHVEKSNALFSIVALDMPLKCSPIYNVGAMVAAVYNHRWYIGKVLDVREGEYHLSFMAQTKNVFHWKLNDELLVEVSDILCQVNSLKDAGKGYVINDEDREMIRELLRKY